jgi:cytochrome c biogenesis protein CcmG/thiol:disulfide interchange protein DsbE
VNLLKKHRIFLVGVNYHDDLQEAQQWLQKEGNPYQVTLFDQHGHLGMEYGVYGIPETFIIDKKGVIRYRHAGPVSLQLWQHTLLPLIEHLNKHELHSSSLETRRVTLWPDKDRYAG